MSTRQRRYIMTFSEECQVSSLLLYEPFAPWEIKQIRKY